MKLVKNKKGYEVFYKGINIESFNKIDYFSWMENEYDRFYVGQYRKGFAIFNRCGKVELTFKFFKKAKRVIRSWASEFMSHQDNRKSYFFEAANKMELFAILKDIDKNCLKDFRKKLRLSK